MTDQKSLKPVQVTVFFPSSMDISEDRARWYLDHAIRGYWRGFATDTDPIRQMSKCSVSISPLAEATAGLAEPVAWVSKNALDAMSRADHVAMLPIRLDWDETNSIPLYAGPEVTT